MFYILTLLLTTMEKKMAFCSGTFPITVQKRLFSSLFPEEYQNGGVSFRSFG